MGQKRKKRVAVVQCAGGCRAEMDALRSEWAGDCRQMSESSPEGICKWGCLGQGSCTAVCRMEAIRINRNGDFAVFARSMIQKWTGRNAWAAVCA